MPKAKPTQVIVHRIELQETERAAMEAALAGNFLTNAVSAAGSVFTGIGSVLAPFGGALTAIAGLWIADRTLDEILGAASSLGEKQKEQMEESFEGDGGKYISYYSAWLQSKFELGGWDEVCNSRVELATDYYDPFNAARSLMGPQWFFDVFLRFLSSVCDPNNVMARDSNPVDLWAQWYSVEQYGKDAYYYAQQEVKKAAPATSIFGW